MIGSQIGEECMMAGEGGSWTEAKSGGVGLGELMKTSVEKPPEDEQLLICSN